ncbi:S2/P23 family protein [Borrelia sp. CA_690]|uniref:S2/P23 family protein n=1 Tax=Borrelia maritima TaxID=2761123 RepID=A0A5J6W9E1_9SPIR|nr:MULTISPECIES: S2/P23 family protein [Borrelia]QFI14304.1 S2/P23 family protein [Borrelia maritima]WKC84159.1 S2/P23 family protein [Borrelia sp. CA_690]
MIFRTYKNLKFIILPMIILGCAFFKKPQSVQQDSNTGKPINDDKLHSLKKPQSAEEQESDTGKPISDDKLHLISGKILNKKLPIVNGNHDVTWIKTRAMTILDEYGKEIPEFKNKFGYSYILSPIKLDDVHSNFVSLLILFETTKNGDKEYEIEDIKFVTAGSTLELKNSLLVVENSQEEGYVNAYPFGILMSDDIKNAFKLTYKNGQWNYMLANLTVKNKLTQETKIYKISLNSKLIIEFLKEVLKENPVLKDIAGDLFEDI